MTLNSVDGVWPCLVYHGHKSNAVRYFTRLTLCQQIDKLHIFRCQHEIKNILFILRLAVIRKGECVLFMLFLCTSCYWLCDFGSCLSTTGVICCFQMYLKTVVILTCSSLCSFSTQNHDASLIIPIQIIFKTYRFPPFSHSNKLPF